MRIHHLIVLLAIGFGDPAQAGEPLVHRCKAPDGTLLFQDRACPTGRDDPAWSAEAFAARARAPAGKDAATARSRQAAFERKASNRWQADSMSRLPPSLGGTASSASGAAVRSSASSRPSDPARDDCRAARLARDLAYDRDWVRLDYEQRGRLDAAVRLACGTSHR
jgi:hypothetical protein